MARMYPRTLLEEDVESEAEIRLHTVLGRDLDDTWEAYHSLGWVARDHAEGSKDGEIDFVLVHPEHGLLCVEVKGKGIECQAGEWYRSGKGERNRIKDPFKQAEDHEYALRRLLEERLGKKVTKALLINHCVAFPRASVHQLQLPPDAPAEILVDRNDLKDPAASFERVFGYHRGSRDKRRPPSAEEIAELRDILAPDLTIRVPMAQEFLEEQEQFIRLTSEQGRLLRGLSDVNRVAVNGCAGSGKTMLAVARAKRLAAEGQDVLFICFNNRLRDHLRETEKDSGVTFHTFHGLCVQFARTAKVDLPDYGKNPPPAEYWSSELPNALVSSLDELDTRFDALIVDEAQDLEPHWFESLLFTLRDPDAAIIWIFLDANQKVFAPDFRIPEDFVTYKLSENCRNTQTIHDELLEVFSGEEPPTAIGPPGRAVERIQTSDQADGVRKVLARLINTEEVPPQDVVVLSPHSLAGSKVGRAGAGEFQFVDGRSQPLTHEVRFCSIRGFKGLESPAIVACELEDIGADTLDQQLYVAYSRARNHLVVIHGP